MTGQRDLILQVSDLRVETDGAAAIIEDLSLSLAPGEVLGLVGESGSGKTTTGLALLGFTNPGTRIAAGRVEVAGHEMCDRPENGLRGLRGSLISYVPQDPAASLNPSLRVEQQLNEVLRAHAPERMSRQTIVDALERVQLPSDRYFRRRYPHQLSGGQQQRLAIAVALVCGPRVAVLDEPTTGLDVVTQARILEEVDRLRRDLGVGFIYVSHDLAVVAGIADRIAVMYAGRIVEEGPTGALIGDPRHPYTHGLISSVPDHVEPRALSGIPGVAVGVGDRPSGCAFAPRCSMRVAACDEGVPALTEAGTGRRVRCIRWQETPEVTIRRRSLPDPPDGSGVQPLLDVESLRATFGSRDREVVAADGVTFTMEMGECLALVGESGSGKTTIARCIVGLHRPAGGRLSFDGRALEPLARQRSKEERRRIQIVFQNPYESLNPRHTVEETIKSAALFFRRMGRSEARREVDELLGKVRLPGRLAARYPSELSGGECQRVAIARALAAQPDLLVCDEVTSALDVSVQAAVLELLNELRAELGLSLLFITHDLGVVASVADRVLVLQQGVVQERGSTTEILTAPQHAYTRRLTSSAPSLSAAAPSRG